MTAPKPREYFCVPCGKWVPESEVRCIWHKGHELSGGTEQPESGRKAERER